MSQRFVLGGEKSVITRFEKVLNIEDYFELHVVVSENPLPQKNAVPLVKKIPFQRLRFLSRLSNFYVFSFGTAFLLASFF